MDEQQLKIYTEYRARLETALQAAYDQFDKAILTLSSGALGLSIAFIKDVVPLPLARNKLLLVFSWVGFTVAILSTVISFLASQGAFIRQIQDAEDFHIEGQMEANRRQNKHAMWVMRLNVVSVSCFAFAVVLTVAFVSINISGSTPK